LMNWHSMSGKSEPNQSYKQNT